MPGRFLVGSCLQLSGCDWVRVFGLTPGHQIVGVIPNMVIPVPPRVQIVTISLADQLEALTAGEHPGMLPAQTSGSGSLDVQDLGPTQPLSEVMKTWLLMCLVVGFIEWCWWRW